MSTFCTPEPLRKALGMLGGQARRCVPDERLASGDTKHIDLTIHVTWEAAGNMHNRVIMASPVHQQPLITRACHLMTPETAVTTHYFFCGTRDFRVDDPQLTAGRAEYTRIAFEEEDKPMLEAVQQAMGADYDLLRMKPLLLPNDAGSIRARRKLQSLTESEATDAAAP